MADVSILKDCSDFVPGKSIEQLIYTVTVKNYGPSNAQNVVVSDTLPSVPGLTFGTWKLDGTAQTGSWTGSYAFSTPLAPDESHVFKFYATVSASVAADLPNSASITTTSDQGANSHPDTSDCTSHPAPMAEVGILKDCSDFVPGKSIEQLIYTVTVKNYGPSNAQNVVVSDTLPTVAGLTFGTWKLDGNAQTSTWSGSYAFSTPLAPDESHVFKFYATVSASVTADLPNSVSITTTSDQGTNSHPDTSDCTSHPAPMADVGILKDCSDFVPGKSIEQLIYTVTVKNYGPSNAENVVLNDVLPAVPGLTLQHSSTLQPAQETLIVLRCNGRYQVLRLVLLRL
jgi:uncharacterized repeat protein (TIGR01451 family)